MKSYILKAATRLLVGLILVFPCICCSVDTTHREAVFRLLWSLPRLSLCLPSPKVRVRSVRQSLRIDPMVFDRMGIIAGRRFWPGCRHVTGIPT
jgi:hypothetical protein